MVFAQEATALTFCRRLYRWFVSKKITPEIEADIIGPLAAALRTGNYEIAPVLAQLLQSQHFFDADDSDSADEIVGSMIKSPLELALQTIAFFDIPTSSPTANPRQLYFLEMAAGVGDGLLLDMGFPLFDPEDVAGYPAYYQEPFFSRDWFKSNTIIPRYKFPAKLLSGKLSYGPNPDTPLYLRLDIVPWVQNSPVCSNPSDPYALVQDLLRYLLPEQTSPERFNYFCQDVFLNNLPAANWAYEWQHYLDTGDDTDVRIPLEKLIQSILYAPEFHTF
jgi:hypothetical protein